MGRASCIGVYKLPESKHNFSASCIITSDTQSTLISQHLYNKLIEIWTQHLTPISFLLFKNQIITNYLTWYF